MSQKHVDCAKRAWQNPEYRTKVLTALRAAQSAYWAKHKLPAEEAARREKESSRKSALSAYHKKAAAYNARRREVYRPTANALATAMRCVLRRKGEPASLESVFRKVLRRASNRAEEKIRKALRRRFESARKSRHDSQVVFDLCGCSIGALRQHLESLFQPGMTWDNYGFYGWHIDHKVPLAKGGSFHFTNLQPLWALDNLRKHDKLPA